jgi:oligopeptide transport system substrate-binding protein
VHRFVFASDPAALAALGEEDGSCKAVLAYPAFRRAFSAMLDRTRLCAEATDGFLPTASLTGAAEIEDPYDLKEAQRLFEEAYRLAREDGVCADGEPVVLRCMVSSSGALSEADKRQEALLNEWLAESAEGTGFAGRITVRYLCGAQDRGADVAAGRIEMIRTAWTGEGADRLSLLSLYTDPDAVGGMARLSESCGWDPGAQMLSVSDGSVAETRSLTEWTRLLRVEIQEEEARASLLSAVERAVLEAAQCVPFGEEARGVLFSPRVQADSDSVRDLRFLYDDAAYEAYLRSVSGLPPIR